MAVKNSETESGIDVRDRRAQFEAFALVVLENGWINVRNDSYGSDSGSHIYSIQVSEGRTVRCSCPSDEYQPGACKHRRHIEAHQPLALAVATAKAAEGR